MQNAECRIKILNSLFDGFKNPHSAFRIPHSKGVTLIEVIMVMVIVGILAVVLMPKIDFNLPTTASVTGAAYMIASDIRYAQEFAMANRVSKTVTFSTATPTVYTFSSNPLSSSDNLDPSGRLPTGVTITSNFTITFNSLGEPIAGVPVPGLVTVSGGGQTKTISVENYTGKASIP